MVTFTCWGCFQTPVILWDRFRMSTVSRFTLPLNTSRVQRSHKSEGSFTWHWLTSLTLWLFSAVYGKSRWVHLTNSTTILSQFHIKEAHTWQHCCLHGENVVSIFCRNMLGSAATFYSVSFSKPNPVWFGKVTPKNCIRFSKPIPV